MSAPHDAITPEHQTTLDRIQADARALGRAEILDVWLVGGSAHEAGEGVRAAFGPILRTDVDLGRNATYDPTAFFSLDAAIWETAVKPYLDGRFDDIDVDVATWLIA